MWMTFASMIKTKQKTWFAYQAIQRHPMEVGKWTALWHINISVENMKAVVFSKKIKLQLPELKLQNATISRVCYLGVILDHRLNWSKHCKALRGKAMRSLTIMKPVLRSSLSLKAKLNLIKSIFGPWWSTLHQVGLPLQNQRWNICKLSKTRCSLDPGEDTIGIHKLKKVHSDKFLTGRPSLSPHTTYAVQNSVTHHMQRIQQNLAIKFTTYTLILSISLSMLKWVAFH